MTDLAEKFRSIYIINEKLDDLLDNINYEFNMSTHDASDSRSYWRQPHIWTLGNIETRIKDAKHIVLAYMHRLKKGGAENVAY